MLAADAFIADLGFEEAYRVGGSVRDEILKREPKDGDYVIRKAALADIEQRAIERGAAVKPLQLRDGQTVGVRCATSRFGTIEIVLPRVEISTGPGHGDFKIGCNPNVTLKQDAIRRDFTINALYRNVHTGHITDPLGTGLPDIHCRWIRTTHVDSFRDDPLRTLRALRFVSSLPGRFDLVESTFQEMRRHAECVTALTLKGVSGTALSELEGILGGERPGYTLRLMRDSGVLHQVLPELTAIVGFDQQSVYHDTVLDEHTFDAVQAAAGANANMRVRMALLFHDAGKPWMAWEGPDGRRHYYALTAYQAATHGYPPTAVFSHQWWGAWLASRALTRLNAPMEMRRDVTTLIERHMLPLHQKVRSMKVREWRRELGDELLADLILHRRCDVLGKNGDVDEAFAALDVIAGEHQLAIRERVPRMIGDMPITGNDLKPLGVHGPQMGVLLLQLLHEVMAQPKLNKRFWLLERAAKLAKQSG